MSDPEDCCSPTRWEGRREGGVSEALMVMDLDETGQVCLGGPGDVCSGAPTRMMKWLLPPPLMVLAT
jgi:hypothetical protein